jgi:RimJ/RimL family protein N-acetyltransferase
MTGCSLAVACNETNVLFGDVYVKKEDLTYWIGYTIKPSKAKQGYAYEVPLALINALKADGAICIKAGVENGNIASIALLEKLSFQLTETNQDEMIYELVHIN